MTRGAWFVLPDGGEVELDGDLSIGRSAENDVSLAHPTVSRHHAVVRRHDRRWFIEDRGSRNGTFVNGARLQPGVPVLLHHADRVEMGVGWPPLRA